MGLSSFNAMRAKMKARNLADAKEDTHKVDVDSQPKVVNKKKTDAEKLKKKEV